MRSERKKQIMTLTILLVSVLVISVGFAAFSSTLKIKTKATVTPNSSDFKVMFSSSENTLETNPVKASPEGMGGDATIDNTLTPTISGLSASFTSPGDTVTYTFYVRNEGQYEAFLNSISFRGKNCTPGEGADVTMVDNACTSITTTVSVGNITTSETKTNIIGESLTPKQTKQVTVTITYVQNGVRADGPFRVEFGDISMYYDAVSGINEDVEDEYVCNLTNDANSNKQVDEGDRVTCGTGESAQIFWVIPNDSTAHPTATGDNITLLAYYNLDVGNIYDGTTLTEISNPTRIQSSSAIGYVSSGYPYYGVIAFSAQNYWGSATAGTFIYNSNSLLYTPVENYKTYVKNLGVDVKEASLASNTQATSFKSYTNFNFTSFWLGSLSSSNYVYSVYSNGFFGYNYYSNGSNYGVRPIIVISKSDIGVS